MTAALVKKLSPWCAVISCENDPNARKERPSEEIVALIQGQVPLVLCTENRPMAVMEGSTGNGIRFEIKADGSVACHEE